MKITLGIRSVLSAGLFLTSLLDTAQAQHSIEVQRLAARGEHLTALVEYQKLPRRRVTPEAAAAAAKSAWALSLPAVAVDNFEMAVQGGSLDSAQVAQITISRGIIEYQEGNYQAANIYAQKAIELLASQSPLRAKAWFLWGEGLSKLNSLGAAEEKYRKALEETPTDERSEIHFAIGKCQMALGKYEEAERSFDQVSQSGERFAEALRYVSMIALETRQYTKAARYLARGAAEFSDFFLDSWVDYARLQVAINMKDEGQVDEIARKANEKFAPSDYWLALLNAAAEGFRWQPSSQSSGAGLPKR